MERRLRLIKSLTEDLASEWLDQCRENFLDRLNAPKPSEHEGILRAVQLGARISLADTLEDVEREMILEALVAHKNNRTAAATALGINRTTLVEKCKKFGITKAVSTRGKARPDELP